MPQMQPKPKPYNFLEKCSANSGAWVISQLDMEDELTPNLSEVVKVYVTLPKC